MSPNQSKRSKRSTERAKSRDLPRPVGKGHVGQRAHQHISDVVEGLDSLPRFLLAADIAALLNVSKTESYRIAAACGVTRLGNSKRLVRVSRGRFLRYLAQQDEAA